MNQFLTGGRLTDYIATVTAQLEQFEKRMAARDMANGLVRVQVFDCQGIWNSLNNITWAIDFFCSWYVMMIMPEVCMALIMQYFILLGLYIDFC